MRILASCFLLLPLLCTACFNPRGAAAGDPYYDLRSEDFVVVQKATVAVGRSRNFGAVPYLLDNLRRDNQWMRAITCQALMEIRGITTDKLGYDYAASEKSREAGISRWKAWYEEEKARRESPPANP